MDLFGSDELFNVFSEETEKPAKPAEKTKRSRSPEIEEDIVDKSNKPSISDTKKLKLDDGDGEEHKEDNADKSTKQATPDKEVKGNANEAEDGAEEDDESESEAKGKLYEDLEQLQKYLPQIELKTLETPEGSGCTHCVATSKGSYYIPLHPIEKPVKTYPFTLDLFQERAVQCVDNYQSVLVSAHTSAGKTVVAE